MNILVSACLLGENCNYKGTNKFSEKVNELKTKHNLIAVCPERDGGLSVPRPPAEIQGDKVINIEGVDVTQNYKSGAEIALMLAKKYDCKYAILKKNSPSCGYGKIYDGTFGGILIDGNGITADLLTKNGIIVFNEDNFKIDE